MEGKMKTPGKGKTIVAFIILIIVVIGIGVGIWWYLAKYTQNFSYDSVTKWDKKTEEKKETNTNTEKSSKVKYTNAQYGFELILPDAWKDYGTEDALMDDSSGMTTEGKTIYFGLPLKEVETLYDFGFNRYYNSPFAISIYSVAQWETSKNQEFAPRKIAENDDYVFTYSQGNGTLSIAGMTQEQAYADIKTIVDTFKFIK